jgi:hypothetical protein
MVGTRWGWFGVGKEEDRVTDRLMRAMAALISVLAVSGNSFGEEATARGASIWLEDYGQARRLARESGKPLFVVFRCQH